MKKSQVLIFCGFCGKSYYIKASRANSSKFCSRKCKSRNDSIVMAGRKMPPGCTKEKPLPQTRLRPAKKCGHLTLPGRYYCAACRVKIYPIIDVNCENCGKGFVLTKSESLKYKCCSMECRNAQTSIRQKGDKSHLWRGGITNQERVARNSARYDLFRRFILARDNFTCQICNKRGGKLCVDHIKEWFLYPALRFDTDNGRTLCVECHRKTDTFGSRSAKKMRALEENGKLQLMLL